MDPETIVPFMPVPLSCRQKLLMEIVLADHEMTGKRGP